MCTSTDPTAPVSEEVSDVAGSRVGLPHPVPQTADVGDGIVVVADMDADARWPMTMAMPSAKPSIQPSEVPSIMPSVGPSSQSSQVPAPVL